MILSFLEILTLTLEDSPTRGHPRFIGKSSKLHVNSAWVALSHWCRGNPNWCDWCDMSGEGITGITSTKATLLTHGYCLSGRIKYREDIVKNSRWFLFGGTLQCNKKRTNQLGSLNTVEWHHLNHPRPRLLWWSWNPQWKTPSNPSSLIHWWNKSLISWLLMGFLVLRCWLGLVVAIRSTWGNKNWFFVWPVFHSDGGLCFIQGQLRVYSWLDTRLRMLGADVCSLALSRTQSHAGSTVFCSEKGLSLGEGVYQNTQQRSGRSFSTWIRATSSTRVWHIYIYIFLYTWWMIHIAWSPSYKSNLPHS